MKKTLFYSIAFVTVLAATPLSAQELKQSAGKMMVHSSSYCTKHFSRQERKYGIPKHLLRAISITESGRWHKAEKMMLPWPWTINVEGKGHFFKSKHDAVTAVNRLKEQGKKSIDIGCMQVNLKHHPEAFPSVIQGFDMGNNVAYAAKLLKTHYNTYGSWERAIASYHSKTKSRGSKYFAKVKYNWQKVLANVAGGTDEVGRVILANTSGNAGFASVESALRSSKGTSTSSGSAASRSAKVASAKPKARKGVSMKVIKVTRKERPRNAEVLVIRPDGSPTPNVRINGLSHEQSVVMETLSQPVSKSGVQHFVQGQQQYRMVDVSAQNRGSKQQPNFIFY